MFVSSGRFRHTLPSLFCLFAALGCGGAGASGAPLFDDGEDSAPSAPLAPPADSGSPTSPLANGGVLPGAPPTTAPAPSSDTGSCATASAAVEIVRQPVDIIITVDNSASMDDEVRAVEANLNVNFATILEQSGIDFRLILVTEHRERNQQDTALCISQPLSTLAACPSDEPGLSERFFQYSTEIDSRDSFEVLLQTYDGSREDDFGLAPSGWSEWLRSGAKKVFLEISDDNEGTPAAEFVSSLTTLAPEQFGADPSQLTFVWHSIVGLAERSVATEPYAPTEPIETGECSDAVNAGATYQELSRLTGGLRFPICEFDAYDAVFRRIASDVVQSSSGACDFGLPPPPAGRALDLDKVAVSYQPGAGGEALLLGQAANAAGCRADGFLVDAAGVHLCPEACDRVGADTQAAVTVLFTCESTLLH
jgi:hypothetical protein